MQDNFSVQTAGVFKNTVTYIPVSYTHLDVYKRQKHFININDINMNIFKLTAPSKSRFLVPK